MPGNNDAVTKQYVDVMSINNIDFFKELSLRETNSAVKEAWEQYQIVLKLARK